MSTTDGNHSRVLRLMDNLRRGPTALKLGLAFALGAAIVAASIPLLSEAGMIGTCPTTLWFAALRLLAMSLVMATVIGLPSWLVGIDPTPLAVVWTLLAVAWRFGPALQQFFHL